MAPPRQAICQRGHPMDDANVRYTKTGGRYCNACVTERKREYRAKLRAGRAPEPARPVVRRSARPCGHKLAHHVCIQNEGHSVVDHRCPCGDTWGVA
jgi:hypothetical protein